MCGLLSLFIKVFSTSSMSDEEDSSAESSSAASDEGETERDWTPPPDWAPRLPSTSDPAARAAQLEAVARRFLEGSGAGVALAEPLEEAFGSGGAFVRFLKKWLPKGLRPILMLVRIIAQNFSPKKKKVKI